MHKKSIYAMDFFTVDTILNKRYYVFFVISHSTKELIRFAITENPTREFVRQQIIGLSEELKGVVYLIHDHAVQFNLKYVDYGIKRLAISIGAPDMNAIAERFVGSVRREALDHYIILNRQQLNRILVDNRFQEDILRKERERSRKSRFSMGYIIIIYHKPRHLGRGTKLLGFPNGLPLWSRAG